ncbi:MAG: hypothetical protein ACKO96_28420, partial [Flammeovirgaceae bacterium]
IAIDTSKNNISFKNLSEEEKHQEILKMFIAKKSPSLNSVGVSLQSRKRMNAALEGYFGNLIRTKRKIL